MTHYKIYLPKTAAKKRYTKHESVGKKLRKRFANEFGGYTKYQAKGGWQNDKNELIEETVFVYEVISNNPEDVFIKANCRWLLRNTDEKMILASIDGKPKRFE
jgi:hypothetical protein